VIYIIKNVHLKTVIIKNVVVVIFALVNTNRTVKCKYRCKQFSCILAVVL